ncbi:hypothetical protein NPIL_687421 [Nephila pilipes]|uniref:Uncharacterized protein n=1 Tax=Nephila pilipes TaxID=299642 RepID=A0A8X6Q5Z3_NEPPI|nr:hypothetical protein NPIL_687421 [Nephila pilipes]
MLQNTAKEFAERFERKDFVYSNSKKRNNISCTKVVGEEFGVSTLDMEKRKTQIFQGMFWSKEKADYEDENLPIAKWMEKFEMNYLFLDMKLSTLHCVILRCVFQIFKRDDNDAATDQNDPLSSKGESFEQKKSTLSFL